MSLTAKPNRDELLALATKKKLKELVKDKFALKLYRPHPKQISFHSARKRSRWFWAGNRVGKTFAGAVEAVWCALGKHPYRKLPPQSGWVVSPTFEVQRDVSQEMIMKFLPRQFIQKIVWRDKAKGYMDRIMLKVLPGPSSIVDVTITFKSAEQGREAFQGTSIPWIWIDEECPVDIYRECLMRTMDCKGDIWGTMTPLIGDLYRLIVEPEPGEEDEEVWYIHASWEDNPYLPESERKRLYATMPDDEREARIHGRWVPKTGRVLSEYREEVHVISPFEAFGEGNLEPPGHWRKLGGFDYGIRSPTAFLAAVTDGENVYFVGEHYRAELTPEEHAKNIIPWIEKGYRRIKADPSVVNRTPDGRSVRQIYQKLGVPLLTAGRGEGSWEYRLELWKQLLHYERDEAGNIVTRPRLFIIKDRCPNLERELRQLRWKHSRSGVLHEDTEGDDHALDSGGYILEDLASTVLKGKIRRVAVTAVEENPWLAARGGDVHPMPHRADWKKVFGGAGDEEQREFIGGAGV